VFFGRLWGKKRRRRCWFDRWTYGDGVLSVDRSTVEYCNSEQGKTQPNRPTYITLSKQQNTSVFSQKRLPLLVVRPLILEPLPILLNAPNLLAIVVRHRIRKALKRRVDTVLLDVLQELLLLLFPTNGRALVHSRTFAIATQPTQALTSEICFTQCFLTRLNVAPPRLGPTSHPVAPHAAVASPNMINGSMPRIICVTSISLFAR